MPDVCPALDELASMMAAARNPIHTATISYQPHPGDADVHLVLYHPIRERAAHGLLTGLGGTSLHHSDPYGENGRRTNVSAWFRQWGLSVAVSSDTDK